MLPEAVQQGEVAFALAHGGFDMHQVSYFLCKLAHCSCVHIGLLSLLCNDLVKLVMLGACKHCSLGSSWDLTACTRCLQYDEEDGHEAFADDFQNAMTYFTKLSLTGGSMPLKEAYPWTKARCIMDVGGGRGELLSCCMSYGSQDVRGVLMDRPWVLDR